MPKGIKIDRILDVRGLLCPRPNLMATRTLAEMGDGETLEVISTDKGIRSAISTLCKTGNYRLLDTREEHGILRFVIEK